MKTGMTTRVKKCPQPGFQTVAPLQSGLFMLPKPFYIINHPTEDEKM